jgi:phosphoribosylglycinamide formyltransferase 1
VPPTAPPAAPADARPAPAPVAVLASGTGSNVIALADAIDAGRVAARIVAVVSDVADAAVLARATARGLPTLAIPYDRGDRVAWEHRLADAVRATGAELVVLAGFMRILTATFLDHWPDRVVNVHPSLLPAFRGAHAVEEAIAAGVRVTGVTVHLVDELVDHGPILAQEAVGVGPMDTAASLHERLHAVEHRLLPHCVDLLARGLVRVDDGRAVIAELPAELPADVRADVRADLRTSMTPPEDAR